MDIHAQAVEDAGQKNLQLNYIVKQITSQKVSIEEKQRLLRRLSLNDEAAGALISYMKDADSALVLDIFEIVATYDVGKNGMISNELENASLALIRDRANDVELASELVFKLQCRKNSELLPFACLKAFEKSDDFFIKMLKEKSSSLRMFSHCQPLGYKDFYCKVMEEKYDLKSTSVVLDLIQDNETVISLIREEDIKCFFSPEIKDSDELADKSLKIMEKVFHRKFAGLDAFGKWWGSLDRKSFSLNENSLNAALNKELDYEERSFALQQLSAFEVSSPGKLPEAYYDKLLASIRDNSDDVKIRQWILVNLLTCKKESLRPELLKILETTMDKDLKSRQLFIFMNLGDYVDDEKIYAKVLKVMQDKNEKLVDRSFAAMGLGEVSKKRRITAELIMKYYEENFKADGERSQAKNVAVFGLEKITGFKSDLNKPEHYSPDFWKEKISQIPEDKK